MINYNPNCTHICAFCTHWRNPSSAHLEFSKSNPNACAVDTASEELCLLHKGKRKAAMTCSYFEKK